MADFTSYVNLYYTECDRKVKMQQQSIRGHTHKKGSCIASGGNAKNTSHKKLKERPLTGGSSFNLCVELVFYPYNLWRCRMVLTIDFNGITCTKVDPIRMFTIDKFYPRTTIEKNYCFGIALTVFTAYDSINTFCYIFHNI